jgi:hypothetical protein
VESVFEALEPLFSDGIGGEFPFEFEDGASGINGELSFLDEGVEKGFWLGEGDDEAAGGVKNFLFLVIEPALKSDEVFIEDLMTEEVEESRLGVVVEFLDSGDFFAEEEPSTTFILIDTSGIPVEYSLSEIPFFLLFGSHGGG